MAEALPGAAGVGAEQGFALGIGLTNECNLSCAFCYRDPTRVDRLDLDQVRAVLDRLPVKSVNLGTGDNGMHPRFREMLALLRSRNVKLTMTSNGLSVAVLDDDELRAFHDLEFSLDYPTREEQDAQRGPGNWDLIDAQAERCRRLGVPVTIIAVMMRTNFRRLAEIARHRGAVRGAPPGERLPVGADRHLLAHLRAVLGSLPAAPLRDRRAHGRRAAGAAMLGLPRGDGGCGVGTVRVTPRATVQPCVYWPGPGDPLSLLLELGPEVVATPPFRAARSVPPACEPCEFRDACGGGCAGRRQLDRALDRPDRDRPIVRGERPRLPMRLLPGRDLPKAGSACTTVVMARSSAAGELPAWSPGVGWVLRMSAEEIVVAYHERTKHHYHRFAASVGYMDWATQPDPFRRYEGRRWFASLSPRGASTSVLAASTSTDSMEPAPLSIDSDLAVLPLRPLADRVETVHETTWSLRANPSSGNLHPTEGYALLPAVGGHPRPSRRLPLRTEGTRSRASSRC